MTDSLRITIDTNNNYVAETVLHAAISSMERVGRDGATLVVCDPITDVAVAEGTYYPYGQNGNSDPAWVVTDNRRGTGVFCATVSDAIEAFFTNI